MANTMNRFDLSLLQLLQDSGALTADQVHVVMQDLLHKQKPIDVILRDLNTLSSEQLLQHKSLLTGHAFVHVKHLHLPKELSDWDVSHLKSHGAFPFLYDGNVLHVAMHDPLHIKNVDALQRYAQDRLSKQIIVKSYHADLQDLDFKISTLISKDDLDTRNTPLMILEQLLEGAIINGASDLHFHPNDSHIIIRYRIDSLMQTRCVLHKTQWVQILNRLKVLGQLDITESRRPQSGHFHSHISGHDIDVRVSTHPTIHGECLVLRLLDKMKRVMTLDELGFPSSLSALLKKHCNAPQGLIILTGPTGVGKTTTLYALLSQMDSKTRNIMTLEAPIEATLQGICQTEILDHSQLSYASGIRSLLRQDPDVILIGEIRDEETAKMALRAVLTGHLVLSTMHTQDALGVAARFIDLGISPAMLAGALNLVVAQRLIRKSCQNCANGQCNETCDGYKGRMAIAEHIVFEDDANEIIVNGALRSELDHYRKAKKFPTLYDHGLYCVEQNHTTQKEIIRVLGER